MEVQVIGQGSLLCLCITYEKKPKIHVSFIYQLFKLLYNTKQIQNTKTLCAIVVNISHSSTSV